MNYVPIPAEVFESEECRSLSAIAREFLIRLYHFFGDCETFVILERDPMQYGQNTPSQIRRKLEGLIEAGVLLVHEPQAFDGKTGSRPRVLKFKYPAVEAYQ